MSFQSTILMHPGLGNSGEQHWQTLWEKQFLEFIRIEQRDWEAPVCSEWIAMLDDYVMRQAPENVILVGHSLACCTVVNWARQYNRPIKGALLVAPSDTEAPSYPSDTTGFTPMPLNRLPFPSITVTSTNDFYVTPERAMYFANAWGSELITIGEAGHINVAAGFGEWHAGLELLKQLDEK
jgi:predicted alpha/beta hydrolase family esterase